MKYLRRLISPLKLWYVIAAVLTSLAGFSLLLFYQDDFDAETIIGSQIHITNPQTLATYDLVRAAVENGYTPGVLQAFRAKASGLVFFKEIFDNIPNYAIYPAILVGYAGYSFQLLFDHLRKVRKGNGRVVI